MIFAGKSILFAGARKHGHAFAGNISKTYRAWQNMKKRCYNPRATGFERWGGRGIKVCPAWKDSFENFLRDMGTAPKNKSLDRLDNDGDYCPTNCQWSTLEEQGRNKRNSVLLCYKGKIKTLTEWAAYLGWDKRTIHTRLKRGWSITETLGTPV